MCYYFLDPLENPGPALAKKDGKEWFLTDAGAFRVLTEASFPDVTYLEVFYEDSPREAVAQIRLADLKEGKVA